jgi:ABC-type nitrate/sulfonate/bicarbonate transport system permease component
MFAARSAFLSAFLFAVFLLSVWIAFAFAENRALPSTLFLIAAWAPTFIGLWVAARLKASKKKHGAIICKRSPGVAFLKVFDDSIFASAAWPILLCAWLLTSDGAELIEKTILPSPITVVDRYVSGVHSGDLFRSLLTTGVRIIVCVTLSMTAAIFVVFVFGELPRLRTAGGRWLRFAALIPPFVLIFYRSTFDKMLRFGLDPLRLDERHESWTDSFVMLLESPVRVFWLALIGFWPLVIIGIDRYLRVSAAVQDETRALRIPWWQQWWIKFPSVLHAMQPGFLLSIAFIVLSCKEIEVDGARAGAKQGFFFFYFDQPYLSGNFELFFVGITGSILIGLALLHVWEWAILILAGSDQ